MLGLELNPRRPRSRPEMRGARRRAGIFISSRCAKIRRVKVPRLRSGMKDAAPRTGMRVWRELRTALSARVPGRRRDAAASHRRAGIFRESELIEVFNVQRKFWRKCSQLSQLRFSHTPNSGPILAKGRS